MTVSKKQFYDSKKAIPLNSVSVDGIVVSNRVKNNKGTSKYFIGYCGAIVSKLMTPLEEIVSNKTVILLCIILPHMSAFIKYFDNGGKNMSFKIENDEVYAKYNSIWNKIKELLSVKFYSEPIYDDNYIKTKVKTFIEPIKTLVSEDEIPKERVEYSCIACISIDSVLRVNGKYYPQVYLERCKYKLKKRHPKNFIDDYELIMSDSDYESD